jgi:hypothetical protein
LPDVFGPLPGIFIPGNFSFSCSVVRVDPSPGLGEVVL